MPYKKISPSLKLKPYIEFYYIWKHDDIFKFPVEVSSPPNICSVLLFNYGDRYQLFNSKFNGTFLPKTFLAGCSTQKFKLKLQGKIGMLGVVFKGGTYRDLFKVPSPSEIKNDRINLELLIGSEANLINEQLAESDNNSEKIQIIENYLIYRLNKNKIKENYIDKAVDLILEKKGLIHVDEIAYDLNMCQRNFRRQFIKRVGISPKFFLRIKRFNYVNLTLLENPKLSWRYFIHDGGYFDQSHLIKDFIEFSGENPSQWLNQRESSNLNLIVAENEI